MKILRRPASLAMIAWIFLILGPLGAGGGPPKRRRARPPVPARAPVGSITSVSEPMIRQVVQRRDDNLGNIVFVGTVEGPVDGFQARTTLRPGMTGSPQDWAPLVSVRVTGKNFVGIYRQAA